MKIFLLLPVMFFSFVYSAEAMFVSEPTSVRDIRELESLDETIYGQLNNFPHTFTFSLNEETPFSVQVSMNTKQEARDVSLILIKQEKRGVSEVGRVTGKDVQWVEKYDFWRAFSFTSSPEVSYVLEPGVYRLEVSAPENNRAYRLVVGGGDNSVVKEMFIVRNIFGGTTWSLIKTPSIAGFFILSLLGFLYYRKRIHV